MLLPTGSTLRTGGLRTLAMLNRSCMVHEWVVNEDRSLDMNLLSIVVNEHSCDAYL